MASDRPTPALERLEKAAAGLRPLEREVLILGAAEHLSNEQIAERLGLTASAVERLLARALRKLDRALERQARPWWRFW